MQVSSDDGDPVSRRWSQWRAATDLEEYHTRWTRLESSGESAHGEVDFIESFHPRSVLDAGCGMGRVAIELAKRGIEVVGVDLDDDLLAYARHSQPEIKWVTADLATMQLGRRFDVVAMPGNVMVFCRPEDREPIIAACAFNSSRVTTRSPSTSTTPCVIAPAWCCSNGGRRGRANRSAVATTPCRFMCDDHSSSARAAPRLRPCRGFVLELVVLRR